MLQTRTDPSLYAHLSGRNSLFSLPFMSDPSWVYRPEIVKRNRKEHIVGLPKTRYLEVLFPIPKLDMQNSNHLIFTTAL